MTVWTVPARLVSVYDGDSIHLTLDLGFNMRLANEMVRLARINAPEMNTPEGVAARLFLASQLQGFVNDSETMFRLTLVSTGWDKYHRALGEVTAPNIGNLSDLMLSSKHATPYGSA